MAGLWVVKERPKPRRTILRMRIKPDEDLGDGLDETVKVAVRPECFTGASRTLDWLERKPFDEFDFGYVLTVHKAQGSQWDDVVLFDESDVVSREPRPLALYRRDARRQAAVRGGVNMARRELFTESNNSRPVGAGLKPAPTDPRVVVVRRLGRVLHETQHCVAHVGSRGRARPNLRYRAHFFSTSRTGVSGTKPPRRRDSVSSPLCAHWPATARRA